MTKAYVARYPNSAELFQFCRQILEKKSGKGRVIDQDVGFLLGFDPADCSHWKHGKKAVRSIEATKSLAQTLEVDEGVLLRLARGDISVNEAFFECEGYKGLELSPAFLEAARKDYFRRPQQSMNWDRENEFRKVYDLGLPYIEQAVTEIHEALNFLEAPLFFPEICAAYPRISLREESSPKAEVQARMGTKQLEILYPKNESERPYIRFQIAAAMALFFFKQQSFELHKDSGENLAILSEVRTKIFAAKLLCPPKLVRQELLRVKLGSDVVSQLAQKFWVSKVVISYALKDLAQ